MKSTLFAMVLVPSALPLCAAPEDGSTSANLRAVLQARTEGSPGYGAEFTVVASMGSERPQLVEARKRHADWVARSHPELLSNKQELQAGFERMLKTPTVTRRFRYHADSAGRIRIEQLPVPSSDVPDSQDVLALRVFDNSQWKSYQESAARHTGEPAGELTIHAADRSNDSWHEVARGAGIALHHRFEGSLKFEISARAAGIRILNWKELLQNIPAEQSRAETSIPPGGGEPKPSLIFETPPFRETGHGMYRLQVWFAPEQGFAPLALAASDLQPAGGTKWEFLPNYVVEWSQPVEVSGGLTMYRKCLIRFYEQFRTVIEGVPLKEWPLKAYDFLGYEYTFSNIEAGKPVDSAMFEVRPPAGTNVIDEPKGYLYVVGNAGEELHKTAIAERERRPAELKERRLASAITWRIVFFSANVVCLLALVIYWFVLRRRSARKL